MKRLITLLALLLMACPGPQILHGTGQRVDPPGGFVDYCNRHPERAECGK